MILQLGDIVIYFATPQHAPLRPALRIVSCATVSRYLRNEIPNLDIEFNIVDFGTRISLLRTGGHDFAAVEDTAR